MTKLRNPPPTYAAIIAYCKETFGFTPKPCWIADAKEQMGYKVRLAPNRKGEKRQYPCPENRLKDVTTTIMEA
ncbi:MAG: hypothetical protein LBP20_08765 [Treponema sp.]|jgi:hypothetical protein|nr:hypothetical protein [Treponema sp.]